MDEDQSDEKLASDSLLHSSRHGDLETVQKLIRQRENGDIEFDINCKGRIKSNLGWSPLHLASYFGHHDVVELLLKSGADVNVINSVGDTPLHRAAYTGRVDVVMLLLKHNADVNTINAEGNTPKNTTINKEIRSLIDATENFETRKQEEELMCAARDGDLEKLSTLLKSPKPPSINSTDIYGNTALHCAAYSKNKAVAILLLQNGIDTSIKNTRGQTALDLAQSQQMRSLLDLRPVRELQKQAAGFEGALLRKSRFLGWKQVWVVLERGVMSIFSNRADASTGSKRKGFKYLDNAKIVTREKDPNGFIVHFSDDTKLSFSVGLVDVEVARLGQQKWLNALGEHIAFSTYYTNRGSNFTDEEMEDLLPLGSMQDALQSSQAHQQVLDQQVSQVAAIITALQGDSAQAAASQVLRKKLTQIVDSSREMTTCLNHCLTLFTQQEQLRKLQLENQMEKSRVLEEALHVLATEHHELEQSLGGHMSPNRYYDTDEDEFYDCSDGSASGGSERRGYSSFNDNDDAKLGTSLTSTSSDHVIDGEIFKSVAPSTQLSKWGKRTHLPVPMFSRNDFSVWSILKQCIGKELSKITMPVIFNEPLSFLQRVTEYMEYSDLLAKASDSNDPVQRIEYVAAFVVSGSASNWDRLGKPFNPLLGETYELNREDLGFRVVCEQVSHHPPISAFHVDSPKYKFHGSVHPKLKFWGKSLEICPKGICTVELLRHGEVYTWQNINCCVHNIIVGKLWVEHYGVMEVTNHRTGHKAVVNFKPSGWFGKDLHEMEGYVFDRDKNQVRALYGKWVEGLYSVDAHVYDNHQKQAAKSKSGGGSSSTGSNSGTKANGGDMDSTQEKLEQMTIPDGLPSEDDASCDLHLPTQECLWRAQPRPHDTEKYYSFTQFAMMLNELDDGQAAKLPPTDARLRPDIRKLEDGDLDAAAEEKMRLEEKQRAARKDRKKKKDEWTPRWFELKTHAQTGKDDWMYTGDYTARNWDGCPDIF